MKLTEEQIQQEVKRKIPKKLAGGKYYAVWNEKQGDVTKAYIYYRDKLLFITLAQNDHWDTYDAKEKKWGKKTVSYIEGWGCTRENKVEFETVREIQTRISSKKSAEREARKRSEIDCLMEQARPLTKDFIQWAKRHMTKRMIFQVEDRHKGYCTCCEKVVAVPEPLKHKGKVMCPECGKRLEIWSNNKLPKSEARTFALFQNIKTGTMCRYVILNRNFNVFKYLDVEDYHDVDLFGESLRVVVENGHRQYWYEKRYAGYADMMKWRRNNCKKWICSMNWPGYYAYYQRGKRSNCVPIYRKNLKSVLNRTVIRYTGTDIINEYKNYARYPEESYAYFDILEAMGKSPQLESLYKIGLKKLSMSLIKDEYIGWGRELHKYLHISKELFRDIRTGKIHCDSQYELNDLRLYEEVTHDQEQVKKMQRLSMETRNIKKLFEDAGLPIGKTLRYLEQKQDLITYMDYIRMAMELNYDLKDSFVRYPRNLEEAHNAALEVKEEEKRQKELEQAKEDDESILSKMKKKYKKFTMQIGDYLIRPAMSATELVLEGQKLHHCVGRTWYREKILEETSYILFLRRKETPDESYYTLEVTPQGQIIQAYGFLDSKPDWEQIKPIVEQVGKEVEKRWKASCRGKEAATYVAPVA